ncbi:MAG TPA: pseudouridine synthase [Candidatus Eisenbacteria bacterium]|nr:pseudouridine synthase [Candidatus Eisenbacteria bacterium]
MASRTSRPTGRSEQAGERLQKLLSRAGVASRRHAEALILGGRVAVNGRVATELGTRADPRIDVITVDGERLVFGGPRRTIVFHKPRGMVATMSDPEGRATVRDVVAGLGERLYPIGRLDLQTSGLLLLTNDGALAASLLAGERGLERVYHVKVDGRPSAEGLARLRRGVRLGDGPPVVATVRVLRERPTKTWLEIGVRRGQWHVVRRLCETIGHPVDKLARVAFGPVRLGDLPPGACRNLTRHEMVALREAAGLSAPAGGGGSAPGAAPRARDRRPRRPAPGAERRRRPRPRNAR